MSDEKNEIELEIDANEPQEDSEIKIETEEDSPVAKKASVSLDDGVEELRAQLSKERTARLEAEKMAREASSREVQARSEVDDTNMQLLNGAISDVKRENLWYKGAIRDALANGDYEKAAEYNEAVATNVGKLMRLEEGKASFETRPKVEPMQRSQDPVEAFASQLSPRSADWIRNNPDFVTDPRLNRKMIAAHEMAMADGMKADTSEYFDYIEDTLKVSKNRPDPVIQKEESALSSASNATQRRSAPPAAPVSRTPSPTAPNRDVVRLNSAEREMAQMMGMSNQEYAKNKLLLIKEGKLPN
jgi:hypothetical protein